jgi:hypothetical protein
LKRNVLEDFAFDAATDEHKAGALLSRKESATQTASLCAFSSEIAGSPLKTTLYSTPSTSQVSRKHVNRFYIT